jgi:hypothetical protein
LKDPEIAPGITHLAISVGPATVGPRMSPISSRTRTAFDNTGRCASNLETLQQTSPPYLLDNDGWFLIPMILDRLWETTHRLILVGTVLIRPFNRDCSIDGARTGQDEITPGPVLLDNLQNLVRRFKLVSQVSWRSAFSRPIETRRRHASNVVVISQCCGGRHCSPCLSAGRIYMKYATRYKDVASESIYMP